MGSVQTDRRFMEQREIPVRRIMITDPTQIPRDLASTPNGTMYCTTPGGEHTVDSIRNIFYKEDFVCRVKFVFDIYSHEI